MSTDTLDNILEVVFMGVIGVDAAVKLQIKLYVRAQQPCTFLGWVSNTNGLKVKFKSFGI